MTWFVTGPNLDEMGNWASKQWSKLEDGMGQAGTD